ncbi:MAG TPA: type II secretion system protein M [Gammaproteobacteria bacterium]|nr:type II secretion system protein M [Gammaproteobacteria bacterium]
MNRISELKAWYLSLQQREQRILAVGVMFVFVTIVYLGLLNPYFNSRKRLVADIAAKQGQVAWMVPAALQLQALRGQQPSGIPASQSLLAVVSRAANDAGFSAAVKQAQTDSDGSVRLQLQGVPFDNLIRWVGTLRRQYGISVKQMMAQKAAAAGNVDATLTLNTAS